MFAVANRWMLKPPVAKGFRLRLGEWICAYPHPSTHVETAAFISVLISTRRHVSICVVMYVQLNDTYIYRRFAIKKKLKKTATSQSCKLTTLESWKPVKFWTVA